MRPRIFPVTNKNSPRNFRRLFSSKRSVEGAPCFVLLTVTQPSYDPTVVQFLLKKAEKAACYDGHDEGTKRRLQMTP
jgi:hypothetical protein